MKRFALLLAVIAGGSLIWWQLSKSQDRDPFYSAPGDGERPAVEATDTRDTSVLKGDSTKAAEASAAPERETLSAGHDGVLIRGRLVSRDGAGIATTTVGLHLGGLARPGVFYLGAQTAPKETTISDAEGRFEFTVAKDQGGHLSLRDTDFAWGKKPPRFLGSREDLDLGDLTLQAGLTLVGKVFGPHDAPLRDATITCYSYGVFGGYQMNARTAKTDSHGRFRLRALAPGQAHLTAACKGYVSKQRQVQIDGAKTGDELVMRLSLGVELSGIVVDDEWQPIAGAQINVSGQGHRTKDGYEYSNGHTKSDAKGLFQVKNLGKGPYQVTATAKGHTPGSLTKVELSDGQVRVELQRLGSVSGRVVDETGAPIADSQVYTTASPPKGQHSNRSSENAALLELNVAYEHMLSYSTGRVGRSVKTDEDGEFHIENVKPGEVWVVAKGPHKQAVHGPIVVQPGKTTAGIQLTGKRGAVVAVLVVDPDGAPIARARVRVQKADGKKPPTASHQPLAFWGHMLANRSSSVASERTDKDGRCEFVGIGAGDYQLTVSHRKWVSPAKTPVRIPDRGRVEIGLELQKGGHLAVLVVDHAGRPAAEQRVGVLRDGKSARSGTTDATGRARLGPFAPGEYEAVLEHGTGNAMGTFLIANSVRVQPKAREMAARVPFQVEAEKTTELKLIRPKLASLSGSVRDGQGFVRGAVVVLRPDRGAGANNGFSALRDRREQTSGENGEFVFAALQPGRYRLSVQRESGQMAFQHTVEIRGTGGHVRDMFLATGIVEVQLQTAGETAKGVSVNLRPTSGTASPYMWIGQIGGSNASAKSDTLGVARFPEVPPGEYSVSIQSSKYVVTGPRKVNVSVAATARIALRLAPAASLQIECVAADGTEMPRAWYVEVTPAAGDERQARRRWMHGKKATVRNLRPGKWRVRAYRWGNGTKTWSQTQTVELQAGADNRARIVLP